MNSIQAKIGWKRIKKRENKKLSFCFDSTRCVIENFQKIAKKFKKLKSTIMGSFQAIIGWKWIRNRENKNYRSISFLPDA